MRILKPAPPVALSSIVLLMVVIVWGYLRLVVFRDIVFPLTFVLPLLLCVWSRRVWQLYTMAVIFTVFAAIKSFWILTDTPGHTFFWATMLNISAGTVMTVLILKLRARLEFRTEQVLKSNAELEAQAEELTQQNEEIRAQSEELAQQTEEIESQREELTQQNEELHHVNELLTNREEMLQTVVECSRTADGSATALKDVCRQMLHLLGHPARALGVFEFKTGAHCISVAGSALEGHPALVEEWDSEGTLVDMVLREGRTAYIDDFASRRDLASPFSPGESYRSALMTPLRVDGRQAGVVVVCSDSPTHWSQDQFKLIEWASAQCGLLLETLHWKAAVEERARSVEAANQAKDSFLASLSHELRTPLTPVLMASSSLESDPRLHDELRKDIQMIRRNVTVQSRLIDDLLDLTRISRGKLDLDLQHLCIETLIRETAAIVSGELNEVSLKLDLDFRLPSPCAVSGDGARLQQVFWNILKNAIKFSPPGGRIAVSATVENGDAAIPAPWVSVTIADEGKGIEAEDMARIFEPFEQAANVKQRGANTGLGLGLSIARTIAELHDGSVTVSSSEGKGACFTVRLPLAAHAPTRMIQEDDCPAMPVLRILLVEDHADTGRVFSELLRRFGHAVTHVASRTDALAEWAPSRFDLIISDMGLPDGTGAELLSEIKRTSPDVRAICTSGFGMESDVATSMAAGFLVHLVKPLSLSKLTDAIKRAMCGGAAASSRA